MYFTECAHLAERHPDLSSVVEQVDAQLGEMGTAEVMRTGDLASFLNADPNQIGSVLEMLAQGDILRREEMIECCDCGMTALRSDYEDAHDEDGEYRCTSCDRPLTDETVETTITYRRGKNWKEGPRPKVALKEADFGGISPSKTPPDTQLDDQAWFTYGRLAECFRVDKDALRKRLDRYREHNLNGWKENEDCRLRESKYLYRLKDVRDVIQPSSKRPAR